MNATMLADKQRALLANVQRLEAQTARLHAQSVRARYEMRCLWELAAGPDDFGIIELAGTARIGQSRAATQLGDAGRMVEIFRGTLACLEAGRISVHMSDLLLSMTRNCSEQVQHAVEQRLLVELEELNTTDGRRRIAETILQVEAELDPDAAGERENNAQARRDVYVRPIEDGMCLITALLDNLTARRWALDFDELVRAQAAVDKADGVTRSAGQRRADVFAALPSQLLQLLQMIANGDTSALLALARLDPEAAEQVHDLAEQTTDLMDQDTPTDQTAEAFVETAAQAPVDVPRPETDAAPGTATDAHPACGLRAYALTLAVLRLKVRDPRVLNVHVAMETLLDLDQRAGWLEAVGAISPYRARCLLPVAGLRRIVTDARSGLPLRIDHQLLPAQALMGSVPLDAATARERLLAMLQPVVLVDEAQQAHDPNRELHELIALRDRTCTGIGCSRPAHLCDDDHEQPWPQGPTAEWNLSNKSRRCHLAKHHGWTVVRDPSDGGASVWTSPLGHTYTRPSPWQPPTPVAADVLLPQPRLVTDQPTTTGPGLRPRDWNVPLAPQIPAPTTAPEDRLEAAVPDQPPF